MFDPISLGIMGGGSMIGAGMSLLGGFMGKDSAMDAQAGQLGMLEQAMTANRAATANAAAMFSPYQLYGSGALQMLQSRMMNSVERKMSDAQQRSSLQSDIDRLSQTIDWNSMPILTGAKASERRAAMWQQMESERKQQLAAAQSKLTAYDREQAALVPFRQEQEAELAKQQGRIQGGLDSVAQAAQELTRRSSTFNLPQSLSQLRKDLTNDPIFQFRQEQGERAINRAAAARGNFLSGAALATIGDFNNQLTADETDRYFTRLLQGQQQSMNDAQLSLGGAVTSLNAAAGVDQQAIANMMGLSQLGLQGAQGASGAMMAGNQVNANLQANAAQGYQQTTLAAGQAMQQGIQGAGGAFGQMAGLAAFQSMMTGANVPKPGATASAINPTNLTAYAAAGGGDPFLVNKPR